MEFWGVEVKPGVPRKVHPGFCRVVHVSQAAIGDVKDAKEAKNVPLRVTIGGDSFVIGTLSAEDKPQLMFDLVFEKDFELSHGWKDGSVYFMGYETNDPCCEAASSDDSSEDEGSTSEDEENVVGARGDEEDSDDDSPEEDSDGDSSDEASEDEENVVDALVNAKVHQEKTLEKVEEIKADLKDVKIEAKMSEPVKPASSTIPEPKEESESDEDSEDSSADEDDSDDVLVGMDGPKGMDFPDDSEDDDSEEETPKKFEQKKRPAPSAKEAPGSAKKAKQATHDKSGGKKSPATPAFAKQNGKPAGNSKNPKAQTPKSGGQFSGKSSNKYLGSQQKAFKGKHGKK